MKKMIKILPAICLIAFANCIFAQIQTNLKSGYSLSIMPETCVTINGHLTNDGVFNLASAPSGESSLIINEDIDGSGTFHVDRYLAPEMWHLVTSPITTGTAGVFIDLFLRPYIEETNSFGSYIIPTNTPMPSGQGFSIWTYSAATRTFTGNINHGPINPNVQLASGTPDPERGWNLIGNPYTSAIDWDAADGWTKTDIANAIYVWNQTQYASYINGIQANGGSRYIAKSQGFFVQATSIAANISMNKGVRLHNPVPFRNQEMNPNMINIKIEAGELADETVIYYASQANQNYDYSFDAAKLYGIEEAPQLYTKKQNNILAINAINETGTLPGKKIYLEAGAVAEHKLTFNHSLVEISDLKIRDLHTNEIINAGEEYLFTAQVGENPERFEFIFGTTDINQNVLNSISAWTYQNILHVAVPQNEIIKEIVIYNLLGSVIMFSKSDQTDLNHLPKGIYPVRVSTDKQESVSKIVIQ